MRWQLGAVAMVLAGPVFGQDVDCQNAMTQYDMTFCASQDFDAADKDLNVSYNAAMAILTQIDDGLTPDQQGAAAALRAAQRAWITVRDSTCKAEGYLWFGGTGQSMAELNCQERLTRERISDLDALAANY